MPEEHKNYKLIRIAGIPFLSIATSNDVRTTLNMDHIAAISKHDEEVAIYMDNVHGEAHEALMVRGDYDQMIHDIADFVA